MTRVRSGLERFLDADGGGAALRPGARLGLVAHPASVDAALAHAVDRLRGNRRHALIRLFAPEHGVRGEAQDMEAVDEPDDPATGLPVVSLYGREASSLRPRPEHLDGLDAVVVDLQDVGSRYYTFVYTLSYAMEAAADAGIPVVVLDRPNPLGGVALEGPVLDPALSSFVGRYPVPVRHGMTVGELALLFRDAYGAGRDVRVVAMAGWRRAMDFEETGLPWVLPSPNMPTPDTARVYPGGCLVEGTNLSEGRGTTRPFELVGAPWIEPEALAASMARRAAEEGLDGAGFRAARFRPLFQKHAGRSCGGVQVHVAHRGRFRPFATYVALLQEARAQAPGSFAWRSEAYEFVRDVPAIDLLLGRPDLRPRIEAGERVRDLEASWAADLDRFRALRSRFLLYPD